ncbi:MAG: M23 family metallopeptidase [Lachnospiraceae bacterium]|nr:M23 family metallopeptidase [Lachnospiraceae bacterium]
MESKNTDSSAQFVNRKKERTVIVGSAVLIIAALTVAGLYVGTSQQEDIILQDLTGIEETTESEFNSVLEEELEDVQSSTVENPGRTGSGTGASSASSGSTTSGSTSSAQISSTVKTEETLTSESIAEEDMLNEVAMTDELLSETAEEMMYSFTGENMIWPIAEDYEILIPYSMDKAVYFTTLDQYKYSPAMVISAEVGTPVYAVSAGKVTSKYWNEETGWTYEMDLGGGFAAYYGQLDYNTMVKEADTYVAAGDLLGYVAEPTKYYSLEGANLYFEMTKDGTPVYPMDYLGQE